MSDISHKHKIKHISHFTSTLLTMGQNHTCIRIYYSQILSTAKTHLDAVSAERKLYRDVCKSSRDTLKATFTTDGYLQPPPPRSNTRPCSVEMTMHYSFDMAQQVKI